MSNSNFSDEQIEAVGREIHAIYDARDGWPKEGWPEAELILQARAERDDAVRERRILISEREAELAFALDECRERRDEALARVQELESHVLTLEHFETRKLG